jgi:hypothetical protein
MSKQPLVTKRHFTWIPAIGISVGLFSTSIFATTNGFPWQSTASMEETTVGYFSPISTERELIESAHVSPPDAAITTEVLSILRQHNALHVAVVTEKGDVLLIGFVGNPEVRDDIVDQIWDVAGVKAVETDALATG